jgi:hypothetical protein
MPPTFVRWCAARALFLAASIAITAALAAPSEATIAGTGAVTHTSTTGSLRGLPGGRCWAYTQAGHTTTQIDNEANALASSPCDVDSWVFQWKVLEPTQGTYDWQLIDAAIQDSVATGKTAVLRVLAGVSSPKWIASVSTMVSIQAPNGRDTLMPVPWSRGFLRAWETFVSAFGTRYDGDAHIGLIETAGSGIFGETSLPGGVSLWDAAGYTEAVYLASIESIVTKYVAAFPRTFLALDVSPGVDGAKENVMAPLVSWVSDRFPTHVYAQQNGLSGTTVAGRQAVVAAPLHGLQMIGPASQPRTGNLCTAFATALTDGAEYVEVYYLDAGNPADYAALRYLNNGKTSAPC